MSNVESRNWPFADLMRFNRVVDRQNRIVATSRVMECIKDVV